MTAVSVGRPLKSFFTEVKSCIYAILKREGRYEERVAIVSPDRGVGRYGCGISELKQTMRD